jgi:AraC-like DNA-binding protein
MSPINVSWLAEVVRLAGFDPGPVLAAVGLSHDELRTQQNWLPVASFDRAIEAALEETADPLFALRAIGSPAATWLGLTTLMAAYAPNVRQVFADLNRYVLLLGSRPELNLSADGASASVRCEPLSESGTGRRFRTELGLGGTVLILRVAGATPGQIKQVRFAYPRPPFGDRYEEWFRCPVEFDASESAVEFDATLLDAQWSGHNEIIYNATRVAADAALLARSRGEIGDKVQAYVLGKLPHRPSIAETAGALHTTERTLRRHLATGGTTYAEVVARCQQRLAERLLAQPTATPATVAQQVGMSTATLHRAFQRWHGVTPAQWRKSRTWAD